MNYFELHIGDYTEATAHLNFIEDAAYSRLIRKYYSTEKPLPCDIKAVQRLVGSRSKEERQAVEDILNEFFRLEDDGWHNARCDEEIARYKEGDAERELKAAHEKDRMRRHREDRARLFAELRELGITPKWDTPVTQLRDILKRNCNASATRTGYEQEQDGNAPATAIPIPSTQPPIPNPKSKEGDSTGVTPSGVVCSRLKKLGITAVNPSHPKLLALLEAGLTTDEIVTIAEEPSAQGKGFAWILAAAEGRRREAAAVKPLPSVPQKPWFLTSSGIIDKGKELGIDLRKKEDFPYFKQQIYQVAGVTDEMVRQAKIDFGG